MSGNNSGPDEEGPSDAERDEVLSDSEDSRSGWGREVYLLFVALGLIVGLGVAPLALSASPAEEPTGTVAVVPVAGQINGANVAVTSAAFEQLVRTQVLRQ
jgi:hypothetical protein